MKILLLLSVVVVMAALAFEYAEGSYHYPTRVHCYRKYKYVVCGSYDYKHHYGYKSCKLPANVLSVFLYHEFSHYKCGKGAYSYHGYYLYVKYGCYAKFKVTYKICVKKPVKTHYNLPSRDYPAYKRPINPFRPVYKPPIKYTYHKKKKPVYKPPIKYPSYKKTHPGYGASGY